MRQSVKDWIMPLFVFLINIFVQASAIQKQVYPFTDEGPHLYAAKLVSQGYMLYKDFGLASHVPFLVYLNACVLQILHFSMTLYHFIYVLWVFTSLFPLFFTVRFLTKSNLCALGSILLFSTFVELVQWDAHFFAVRQASLPFFAFFIYFTFRQKRKTLGQFFRSEERRVG